MNNSAIEKEVLTVSQVAEYLQLSEMTTYKLVQEGKILLRLGEAGESKKVI